MSEKIVIYHGWCQDGFGAALSAWKKFGSDCQYHAASHGDTPPETKDREVYIVDYAYKRDKMIEIKEKAKSIVVLDHHISAQKELEGLDFATFDMTKSGARLAWEYFHPDKDVPDLILNIEDRDLWNWKIKNSKAVTAAIETWPYSFKVWNRWLNEGIETLLTDGLAILRYQDQMIRKIKAKPEFITMAGHKVPQVNCPILSSELGNALCKNQPFAVIWRKKGDLITYSLRSAEDGEDVSVIAAAFGGGGHPRAAGFSVNTSVNTTILPSNKVIN